MRLLPISDDPNQHLRTPLEDGTNVSLTLRYYPFSERWSVDVKYKDFELNGQKVFNSLNMLYQFSQQIPFGINITVVGGGEPFLIGDFQSGRAQLFILNSEEVYLAQRYFVKTLENPDNLPQNVLDEMQEDSDG